MTFGGHSGDHRLDNLPHDPRLERGIDKRARRERPHAARVGPTVFVEHTLVVLSGADRHGASSVADEKERNFRPTQALFDHNPVAGRAELSLPHRVRNGPFRGRAILGDHDAFSRSQPVRFHHHRKAELIGSHRRERLVDRIARAKARRRHAVTGHEGFRERLARFETCGGGGRPEKQPAFRREPIGDPATEGQFGTDDGQVDLLAIRQRQDAVQVARIDGNGPGETCDARVPGNDQELADIAISVEPGDERMLAPAAADYENSHYVNDLGRRTWVNGDTGRMGLFR